METNRYNYLVTFYTMQKIEIIITEESIIKTTWYDFEALAIANGYQNEIQNSEYSIFTNPDVPRKLPNPQSPVEFLAQHWLSIMIQSIASPIISRNTSDAQIQAQDTSRSMIESVIANSTVNIG